VKIYEHTDTDGDRLRVKTYNPVVYGGREVHGVTHVVSIRTRGGALVALTAEDVAGLRAALEPFASRAAAPVQLPEVGDELRVTVRHAEPHCHLYAGERVEVLGIVDADAADPRLTVKSCCHFTVRLSETEPA
jgi:hypothetical protein